MTGRKTREEVIAYWMNQASEALASARSEQKAGRCVFAVNRAYYACFYAASSVLMDMGETFRKHTGVRAAVHRKLIRTGILETKWGAFYDLVFESRKRGDYQEMVSFSPEETEELISNSEHFVDFIKEIFQ